MDPVKVFRPRLALVELEQCDYGFVNLDVSHQLLKVRLDNLGNLFLVDTGQLQDVI